MSCCGLESGDAVPAIPFRNLINCAAQPFRMSAGGLEMNRNRSKSRVDRTMPMVHPNAAAIDIGATMHMAAVRADRAPEPVRSFGTFTADLHRLVDWFMECGAETVVMESTSVRSEEHTSELQSRSDLVCRLLLENKKKLQVDPYRINKKNKVIRSLHTR